MGNITVSVLEDDVDSVKNAISKHSDDKWTPAEIVKSHDGEMVEIVYRGIGSHHEQEIMHVALGEGAIEFR